MSIEVRVTPFAPQSRACFRLAPGLPDARTLRVLERLEVTSPGDHTLALCHRMHLSSMLYVQCATMGVTVEEFLLHLNQERPDLTLLGVRTWAALKKAGGCDFKHRMCKLDAEGNACVVQFGALVRKEGKLSVPTIRFRKRYGNIVWGATGVLSYQTLPSGFLALRS